MKTAMASWAPSLNIIIIIILLLLWSELINLWNLQYEEISSMGMFLTETQRKWVNFLKEAAKKKPPTKGLRPKVNMKVLNINLVLVFMQT